MERLDNNLILNQLVYGTGITARTDSNAILNALADGSAVLPIKVEDGGEINNLAILQVTGDTVLGAVTATTISGLTRVAMDGATGLIIEDKKIKSNDESVYIEMNNSYIDLMKSNQKVHLDDTSATIYADAFVRMEEYNGGNAFEIRNTGFKLISNSLYSEIKGDNLTSNHTLQLPNADGTISVTNYKVYTALLNQENVNLESGTLTIGKEYIISELAAGDDFSNVGYIESGVKFTATDTTPTVWTGGTFVLDCAASAPTAVILENTLNEVPTYTYDSSGTFFINSSGNTFTTNKTFVLGNSSDHNITIYTENQIYLGYFGVAAIQNWPIEIRVYN